MTAWWRCIECDTAGATDTQPEALAAYYDHYRAAGHGHDSRGDTA